MGEGVGVSLAVGNGDGVSVGIGVDVGKRVFVAVGKDVKKGVAAATGTAVGRGVSVLAFSGDDVNTETVPVSERVNVAVRPFVRVSARVCLTGVDSVQAHWAITMAAIATRLISPRSVFIMLSFPRISPGAKR